MNASTIKTNRVKVIYGASAKECDYAEAMMALQVLVDSTGLSFDAKLAAFEEVPSSGFRASIPAVMATQHDLVAEKPAPVYSEFGAGNQVQDTAARARILASYDAIEAAGGPKLNREKTIAGYVPGDRMAKVGYDNQQARADEHAARMPLREAASLLSSRVVAEKRRDVVLTAADVAAKVSADPSGRIVFDGLLLTEQAIRGLSSRVESPSLRYLLGVRDRVVREGSKGRQLADRKAMAEDRERIADTLRYELRRNGSAPCKLRVRDGVGDVFAAVSPDFGNADAPELVKDLLAHLPEDARGTYSYDPRSTDWELRAALQTSTPVIEQAVGEPFEGYCSFGARDNGTRRLSGGGGILVLACLNAGVYVAPGKESSRIHRKNVMLDVESLIKTATASIEVFAKALGRAREEVLELPKEDDVLVPIEVAIPGFWNWLLRDRSSELAGVLPGKSKDHVEKLSAAYADQRRDEKRVVRSDLAQAWTSAIQTFPTAVRRDAERAVGAWLVNGKPVGCDLEDSED